MKSVTVDIPLRTFLVKKLRISHKKAVDLILSKQVYINGKPARLDQNIELADQVEMDGNILKAPEKKLYLAYYKPRGIETTLNTNIANNLVEAVDFSSRLFPIGRLDKESEGLLLLTNDGNIYNKISHSKQQQEKEYVVSVDKDLTEEFISAMTNGVTILGKKTREARVYKTGKSEFRIVLTQGFNRQIRRMCYKLDYEVRTLKRIRVVNISVNGLYPGQWRYLEDTEINELIEVADSASSL